MKATTTSNGKVLTEELIIKKTNCPNLELIKNLNLWGSDIEDISILNRLPNAEVLSLSVNRIGRLRDLKGCLNLQELYLRKNQITDINELSHLVHLKQLKVLWLLDNPCTDASDYRKRVIGYLPNLQKLDNTLVSPEEKAEAIANGEQKSVQSNFPKQNNKEINNGHLLENSNQKRTINNENNSEYYDQNNNNNYNKQNWQRSNTATNSISSLNNNQSQIQQDKDSLLQQERQNQNIVCAILSLAQDLDPNSLEIVHRNVLKYIQRILN